MNPVRVSSLWWLWIVITIPVTGLTITCWWLYKKHKAKEVVDLQRLWSKTTKEEEGDGNVVEDENQNTASGGGSGSGGTPFEKSGAIAGRTHLWAE